MNNLKLIFVYLLIFFLPSNAVHGQVSREIQRSLDLKMDGQVMIDTYKGSLTIETWDKPEVDVHATIEADGWGRHEKEKVRNTKVIIRTFSDGVEIKSDYDKIERRGFSFFNLFSDDIGALPFIHYRIMIPKTARLKVKDYKSDTKISDLCSDVEFETYKGTVELINVGGKIHLETYKGKVWVNFLKFTDDCRFETYKGKIELNLPNEDGFILDASIGKRAYFDCDFDVNLRTRTRIERHYWGKILNGGPTLHIKTDKGDIQIFKK